MKFLLVLFLVVLTTFYTNCEKQNGTKRRIFGGVKATIEELPYQVSIAEYEYQICGGSIVNNMTIITAAHCTNGLVSPKILRVKVGTTDLSEGNIHEVDNIIQHPKYSPAKEYISLDYDICILKLKTPIVFNEKAQPIALHEAGKEVEIGNVGVISGWGTINENSIERRPKVLRKANVEIYSTKVCQKYYDEYRITDRMICAGDSNKDSCDGDSGGPLVYNKTLIGIISWGEDCGDVKYPGVYTKISALRDWIDENIK